LNSRTINSGFASTSGLIYINKLPRGLPVSFKLATGRSEKGNPGGAALSFIYERGCVFSYFTIFDDYKLSKVDECPLIIRRYTSQD
jgi:hypothetical protein